VRLPRTSQKAILAECDLQATEHAEAGCQESGGILIAHIKEIIYAPEGREIFADLVTRGKIEGSCYTVVTPPASHAIE
jgi:hypothetical protein